MIVKGIPKKDIPPPERRKTPHHDNNDGVHGSKASSVNGKSIKKRRSTGLPDENGALEDDDDEDDINAHWRLRFSSCRCSLSPRRDLGSMGQA